MNIIDKARKFRDEMINKHPDYELDIKSLYSLMLSEISEGGSSEHEYSLFVESVKELVDGDN
jgi:hypothetical protein